MVRIDVPWRLLSEVDKDEGEKRCDDHRSDKGEAEDEGDLLCSAFLVAHVESVVRGDVRNITCWTGLSRKFLGESGQFLTTSK